MIDATTRLASHYPNSGHDLNTLLVVAEDWFETYQEITEDVFLDALKRARRGSRFFPNEEDIDKELKLKADEEIDYFAGEEF